MNLLAELRTHTTHLHERLDRAVSQTPIASRAGYARFLLMHARVLPHAERWLAGQPAFASLPGDRMRTDALMQDVAALGLEAPLATPVAFGTENAVAGVAYVLEGSRLGARYLLAELAKSDISVPDAFLRHGEGQHCWKTFRDWLASQPATPSAVEAAVTSARAVFAAYLDAVRDPEGV